MELNNEENPAVSDRNEPSDISQEVELPIYREALYELVWAEPMLKVAEKFDVSSSYMARVCTEMNVPRPERGYWAKLAAGKDQRKVPLPEAQPSDLRVWSRDGHSKYLPRLLPKPPEPGKSLRSLLKMQESEHRLIVGAKSHFEDGSLSYEGEYLKPAKRLLVDLIVSKPGLDKALAFANQLFLALERKGHRVVIASQNENFHRPAVDERENQIKGHHHNNLWSPFRSTVVYIGTVAIGLTLVEMSEEVEVRHVNGAYVKVKDLPTKGGENSYGLTWTTTKYYSSGRLSLKAYSPYPSAEWKFSWNETPKRKLETQICAIVKHLEAEAIEIARLVEEGERQAELEHQKWEAQREQWRREAEEQRVAKALKDSKEELHRIVDQWAESKIMELFFIEAERRAEDLEDGERAKLLERLRSARKQIGNTDALDRFKGWKTPDER